MSARFREGQTRTPFVQRLRTAPSYQTRLRVDRAGLAIHEAVGMLANVEALGHGMQSDLKTLTITAALANQHRGGLGLQGRFGHPGASENSAGRKFMLSRNFRVQDGKLLHDIELMPQARNSPAFSGDIIEYMLDMAEHQPQEIAESFVLETDLVWTLDDGGEIDIYDDEAMDERGVQRDPDTGRPLRAQTPLPVMRPVTLYYLDVVNEGALTHDGLFSSETARALFTGTSNAYAQQFFELADELRAEYHIPLADIPRKVDHIVGIYMSTRGEEMAEQVKKPRQQAGVTPRNMAAPASDALQVKVALDELDENATNPPAVQTPPPAQSEDNAEPEAEDDLDVIEQESGEVADATEPGTAAAEPEPTPNGSEADTRVDAERMAALEAKVEKLTRIVVNQHRAIKNLAAYVREVESQPNITMTLGHGGTRTQAARARSLRQAEPPKRLLTQRPTSVEERAAAQGGGRPQDEAALAVLAAQQRRSG